MNEPLPLNYNGRHIRMIVDENGNPWWVARDVSEVLGYSNPRQAIATHLDDDEKRKARVMTPGGEQNLLVINEPGLYTLALRSRKPEAKNFRRWVTHEVFPLIRKTYTRPDTVSDFPGRDFRGAGLKTGQRLRLMEIAGRFCQKDIEEVDNLLDCYNLLCSIVAGPAAEQPAAPEPAGSLLDDFITDCCVFGPGLQTSKNDLYSAYLEYSAGNNSMAVDRQNFFKTLYQHYPEISTCHPRIEGRRVWALTGIGLRERPGRRLKIISSEDPQKRQNGKNSALNI